jgi:hypothetical protein
MVRMELWDDRKAGNTANVVPVHCRYRLWDTMVTGYLHPGYAKSLAAYGTPRELPRSGAWVLERAIPGSTYRDAMGCYPLFACRDWSGLKDDLNDLASDFVSVCLVPDPFGEYTEAQLRDCFPDRMVVFKQHYVLDTHCPIQETVSKSAQRNARAALRRVEVELCPHPSDYLNDWVRLYECLIRRHDLQGLHRFSREVFLEQMQIPGYLMFRAFSGQDSVGMMSWFVQGDTAYSHLACMDSVGYTSRAAYALYWSAIQHLGDVVRWIDFAGPAGSHHDNSNGLAEFKRQWSSGARPAYLCGRIFDHAKYDEIVRARGIRETDYFPAYRSGELITSSVNRSLVGHRD